MLCRRVEIEIHLSRRRVEIEIYMSCRIVEIKIHMLRCLSPIPIGRDVGDGSRQKRRTTDCRGKECEVVETSQTDSRKGSRPRTS